VVSVVCAVLFAQIATVTVVTGKVVDLSGQPAGTNRTVVFTLKNCGSNPARVVGSAVVVPPIKEVLPNQASMLTGSLVGNDVIECGSTLGQTYYEVTLKHGSAVIYTKNYFISGGTSEYRHSNVLNNDPTPLLGRDVHNRFTAGPAFSASNSNVT
jgi:hypothetical protein